jgi:uncharacterized membrane protein
MLGQAILAGTLALIGLLMYYLPVMKGPDAFFGVPVSDEFYRGPVARKYLRVYWLVTAFLVAGAIAFLFGAEPMGLATPGTVLGVVLVAALGPLVPLVVIWRRLRPYEARGNGVGAGAPTYGNIAPGSKWRYVSPWVEVVLLAALIALAGLTVWRYPTLPDRIPVHWGPTGQADGWQHKSPLPLLSLLLLLGYMHGIMLALLVGMAQIAVRLPAMRAEEYLEARERYMRTWVQALNVMRFGVMLMFGGIIWASLFGLEAQARGTAPPGMMLVWAGAAPMLTAIGWVIVKGLRIRAEMREIAGPGSLESTAPTEGWIGGMIYYNKRDPALWVEKRIGVGWTVNLAHPMAWAIVGFAILVPIGITVIGLVGTR